MEHCTIICVWTKKQFTIVSSHFHFIVDKNKYNFGIKRIMWRIIFLFTEEQIKQRKQYEKAERQREMEICRQLVSLYVDLYFHVPEFQTLYLTSSIYSFASSVFLFTMSEPIRRITMGTSWSWRSILESKCSDRTKILWQNGKRNKLPCEIWELWIKFS